MKASAITNERATVMRNTVLGILRSLAVWQFDGEESRTVLHKLGIEIKSLRTELASIRRAAQFPSFTEQETDRTDPALRQSSPRRRELIRMVYGLPPSNLEILDWLEESGDKEAAYLYAYARGSASNRSEPQRSEFYDHVDGILDADPLLMDIKELETLFRTVRLRYSECQAHAYERLD